MLSKDDADWATHYLSHACFLYSDWNAIVKVEQMLDLYPFVRLLEESPMWLIRRALEGKSCYDENHDSLVLRQDKYLQDVNRQMLLIESSK